MAWKKIIVSGSSAHLNAIQVGGTFGTAVAGEISASNKLYISASNPSSPQANFNVLIREVGGNTLGNGKFAHTSSAFLRSVGTFAAGLASGSGIKYADDATDPLDAEYNGTQAATANVDLSVSTGNGILGKGLIGTNRKISASLGAASFLSIPTNLAQASQTLNLDSASLADTNRGIVGSAATDKLSAAIHSTLQFGSGNIQKKAPDAGGAVGANLVSGNGFESLDFTFSEAGTATVRAQDIDGTGLIAEEAVGDTHKLRIRTSSIKLADGAAVIFDGTGFESSSVSFGTNTITLGNSNGSTAVTAPGALFQVQGTSSFNNRTDFSVDDEFLLLNSGSGGATGDAFGIMGQTGSNGGVQWVFSGSRGGASRGYGWALSVQTSSVATGDKFENSNLKGRARLHLNKVTEAADPNTETFHEYELGVGNTLDSNFSDTDFWIYTGA